MAVTERAVFPTGTTGTAAANNTTQSVTVVAGDVLEAQVVVSAGTDTSMTVACTANSVAADGSSATIHSNTQTAGFEKVFYWLAPATGTYNVVATVSGGTPDSVGLKVRALAGTDGNAPTFVTTGTPNDTTLRTAATSGAVTLPNNGLGISHFCAGTAFSSTGQTTDLISSIGGASAATEMCGAWAAGTGAAVTFTATIGGSGDWYAAIVSVWAAAGGGVAAQPWTAFNPGAALKRQTAIRRQGLLKEATKVVPSATWFTDAGLGGSGNPLLLVSAEDWGLLPNAALNHAGDTTATWNDYFTSRAAQGYNCVQVSMFGYGSGAGFGLDSPTTPEGGDVDGVYPFTTNSNNPSNPNNATWWNRRTAFFASAAAHGFYVICNITTPNLNSTVFTNTWTTTQWTDWGTKLAAAFGSTSNILWIAADDYFGTIDSNLNALLASMRTGGCNQPVGIQWYQETSCRKDIFNGTDLTTNNNWARDAQYNFGYSYNVWYDVVEKMGNEVNPVPHFAADGTFLNTGGITSITDKQLMRRQVWWSLSSGSKGFQVGDNNVWTWPSTALAEVTTNTFYTSVVPAISTYFRSLPNWHKLLADTSSQLVTAGRGTHASPLTSGGSGGQYLSNSDSYVTASRTADGTLAVIYMSHGSTITIDESKMVAGYTATWVDPKTCATTTATPGPTYNSTAKGTNSDGEADWVLVLAAPTGASSATATVAETVSITASGAVATSASATVAETVTITAASTTSASATVAETVSRTAAGVVATSASATVAETVTITAGSSATGQASVASTVTATASGSVATTAAATVAETVSLTASAAAAGQATVAETVTITAAGSVTTGVSATVTETVTITASGLVATSASGTVTETVSVTASATTSTGATVTETVTITAAGTVTAAGQGTASVVETVTITAAGVVATSATASVAETVTIAGSGTSSATATRTETVTITAAGLVSATATRTTTVTVTASGLVATSASANVVTSVTITATAPSPDDPNPRDLTLRERATVTIGEARTATIRERSTVTIKETSA